METESDHIGIRLAYFRKKRGMTQNELSQHLGVVQGIVSGYENGTKRIYVSTITKICTLFEITPNELFGYDSIEGKPIENLKLRSLVQEISDFQDADQKAIIHVLENYISGVKKQS